MTKTTRIGELKMRVPAMVLVAVLAVAGLPSGAAYAQQGNDLVGSWRVTVNVTSVSGFPPFPVMMTFHADGTAIQALAFRASDRIARARALADRSTRARGKRASALPRGFDGGSARRRCVREA